jgi:hypothetical protein
MSGSAGVGSRAAFAAILRNTFPDELRETAGQNTVEEFLALYGEAPLLVIHLDEVGVEVATGLAVTALRDEASIVLEPTLTARRGALGAPPTSATVSVAKQSETDRSLLELMSGGRRFVVPLRKRITAESMAPDRVTLGRAPNRDIVIRDATVSKFQAWFEVDTAGTFFVCDAQSKNATRLNGHTTFGAVPVTAGDTLRFGRIDATLASPRALWRVLASAARRAV